MLVEVLNVLPLLLELLLDSEEPERMLAVFKTPIASSIKCGVYGKPSATQV